MDNNKIDEGLQGNEKIETAIAALQQEASEEMLAHTLTVIRRRMKEGGQFIVAVEPPTGGNQMQIQAVQTPDGNSWWAAFTSFEEELKGSGSVMSTFLTGIEQALLSKFENGERVPPTETLIRLADFYDVSIDYILCRTNNPHIEK